MSEDMIDALQCTLTMAAGMVIAAVASVLALFAFVAIKMLWAGI